MVVSPFSKVFDRKPFSCGVPVLDEYLKKRVGQDRRRDLATCYVLHQRPDPRVLGYYTFSSSSVRVERFPVRLPYEKIPVFLIGRFAVDEEFRKRHERGFVGDFLLEDAFSRALKLNELVAASAVIVDAKNDRAKAFYERNGLTPFPDNPNQLFITMKEIRKRFSG